MIAKDFDGFIEKVTEALRQTLNGEAGQDITREMLKKKMAKNPDLTPEEWAKTKSEFLTFLFCQFIKDNPEAMEELAGHVWDELQKEGK